MALDRFIYWNPLEEKPSADDVRLILEDYLGGVGEIHCIFSQDGVIRYRPPEEGDNWFFVKLPGKPSFPLKSQNISSQRLISDEERYGTERWFEVCCIANDNIDIITRLADEFTNDIAHGFAKLIARWFKGNLDE